MKGRFIEFTNAKPLWSSSLFKEIMTPWNFQYRGSTFEHTQVMGTNQLINQNPRWANLNLRDRVKQLCSLHFHFYCVKCSQTSLLHPSYSPEVSADCPCRRPNIFPHALLMAAIFAMTGRLWMTNETSFFWMEARFFAWPSRPKPVTSVAPCALNLCINLAAGKKIILQVCKLY